MKHLTQYLRRESFQRCFTWSECFGDIEHGFCKLGWFPVPAGELRNAGPQGGITLAPSFPSRPRRFPFRNPSASTATFAGADLGGVVSVVTEFMLRRSSIVDRLQEGLGCA